MTAPETPAPFAFGSGSLARSVAWQVGSRLAVQAMALVVQIVLARVLVPEDFGAVAITLAVVNTLLLIVQGGFGIVVTTRSSLDADELATLFWLSLGAAIVLYCAVWFCAEPIAQAYDDPRLARLLRVVGTLLFLGAFTNVQTALALRRFLFRGVFWASCAGALVSGVVAVAMALHGAGLWAVVAQTIINQVVSAMMMLKLVRWWPSLSWAPKSATDLLKQGLNLLIPSLLYGSFTGLTSLAVGRLYGATILGYYDRGRQFPEYLFGSVNQAVQSVALPAMSRSQSDHEQVRSLAGVILRTSCILLFPAAVGFAVVAPDLIPALLGQKWAQAVPYVQLSSLFFIHIPISHTNQRVMLALGRSDLTLRLNVVEVLVAVTAVSAGAYLAGPLGLMVGLVASGVFNVCLFAVPNGKLIRFGLWSQLRLIGPVSTAAGALAVVVWQVARLTDDLSIVTTLLMQVGAGTLTYGTVGFVMGFLRPSLIRELRDASRPPR